MPDCSLLSSSGRCPSSRLSISLNSELSTTVLVLVSHTCTALHSVQSIFSFGGSLVCVAVWQTAQSLCQASEQTPARPGYPPRPAQTTWEGCVVWTLRELGELLLSSWCLGIFQVKEWTKRGKTLTRVSSWLLTPKTSVSDPVFGENSLKAGSPSKTLEV